MRLEKATNPGIEGLIVHAKEECDDNEPCVIHNPSDHHMADWLLNWRGDRHLMERICEHGVGHPDPDHIRHVVSLDFQEATSQMIHGCDGCCTGAYKIFLLQAKEQNDDAS